MIKFDIITIFPEIFDSYFNESILKRAQKNKLIKIQVHNLRDYSDQKNHHRQVDDRPYGGGPGMILMVEPVAKAIQRIKNKELRIKKKTKVIMLTPAGKQFDQKAAQRLVKYNKLILLCGRYEGFDARLDKYVDEKISIGPYVLSGGEIPAMVITEAVARNIPGVLGHEHALDEETYSGELDYIEYPQYTRPEKIELRIKNQGVRALRVPKVLLSGNHAKIKAWRTSKARDRDKKS